MRKRRVPFSYRVIDGATGNVGASNDHYPQPQHTQPIPEAHKFHKPQEDWERDVFVSAEYFQSVDYVGLSKEFDKQRFNTFQEAYLAVGQSARSLIYAMTKEGRSVCLPRERWHAYLAIAQGKPVIEPKPVAGKLICKGCGTPKGVKKIGDEFWHASCWRMSNMK